MLMTKIVKNTCYWWFWLSYKWVMKYAELKWIKIYAYDTKSMNWFDNELIIDWWSDSGFWLSYSTKLLDKWDNINDYFFSANDIKRDDEFLVQTVKELWKEANWRFSDLKIVAVPDNIEREITEYDWLESVEEKHRSW